MEWMIAWSKAQAIFEEKRKRFASSIGHCEEVQSAFLAELIQRNRNTRFGQSYGFDTITSYQDYASKVPLATYDQIQGFIECVVQGEKHVLTQENVCFTERTGGSTGGAKIIPYTPSALEGFQNALFPWFADLLERRSGIKNGSAYFAISPAGRTPGTYAGILPLGNNDDAAYFGSASQYIRQVMTIPHAVSRIENIENWQFITARLLLEASDISFIFIWSPTFLTELLRVMMQHHQQLADAIATGAPGVHGCCHHAELAASIPNPTRAKQVAESLAGSTIDTVRLWPKLDTISCWMDAASEGFARQLQAYFPHVYFQPKGLLSTEGASSFPFGDNPASVLAIESCFFEFMDDAENARLAHQLQEGMTYRVIISNHSGLYRYDTGDLVKVMGFFGSTPRIIFCGRADLTTDLCGEKMTEAFVLDCFKRLPPLNDACAFLIPSLKPHPHYTLMIDGTAYGEKETISLTKALDKLLCENPQYAYARKLKQLSAIHCKRVNALYQVFAANAARQGRQIGTLKPPVLLKSFDL